MSQSFFWPDKAKAPTLWKCHYSCKVRETYWSQWRNGHLKRCNNLPVIPRHNGWTTPGPCVSNHSSTIRSRQLGFLPEKSCSSSQSSSIKTPTAKIRWQDYADGLKQMKRKSSSAHKSQQRFSVNSFHHHMEQRAKIACLTKTITVEK